MERRELIQWLVATAGIAALDTLAPDDLAALGRDVHAGAASTVDPTIAAVAERILPGAGEAGVPAFIEKMLADWHTPEERAVILAGLKDLDLSQLESIDQASPEWYARLKYLTVYGYCTSEVGMRALKLWPQPWRYDGCAPV
ncbi:MAG TPA: gluconate 2-dehydrogenase subunit 3 family protein [Gemmatimonadales bacterium]|nr:gluconate 2-dehydrogenase subunit 3 family protein [Gemmatimonadales bacterium]